MRRGAIVGPERGHVQPPKEAKRPQEENDKTRPKDTATGARKGKRGNGNGEGNLVCE